MTHRYFFGLMPDEVTRDRLVNICALLRRGDGKLVQRKNLHLTLAFLGLQEAAVIDQLREGAAMIQAPAFTLQLDQSGWWRKPQVVWLGALSPPQTLLDLVTALTSLQMAQGIHTDNRPYLAHLTIARKVTKKPGELAFDPVTWPVSSFSLVQSRTLPAGAEYEVLETWPLSSA